MWARGILHLHGIDSVNCNDNNCCLHRFLLKNNRAVLGLAYILCLSGCTLMSDWQAIGGDTCSPLQTNVSNYFSGDYYDTSPDNEYNSDYDSLHSTSNLTLYQFLLENCEAQSSTSHQCFWNPHSRITGEYCNTCLPTCLSHQTSLNLYQFSLGVLLVFVGSLLGYLRTNAIASDITPVDCQV